MKRLLLATPALVLLVLLLLHASPLAIADEATRDETRAAANKQTKHNVAPEGWEALFNGKDIDGWVVKSGYATYVAEDGMITGTTAKGSGNTFLCAPGVYGDFELTFDVLLHDDKLNSGCQVRSKVLRDNKYGGRVGGPQVEVSANRQAGYIYGEGGLGGWWSKDIPGRKHEHFKSGEWNHYHVIAKGNVVKTFINGNLIDEMTYPEKYKDELKKGLIGLQVHGVKGDPKWRVSWRNIYIKDLNPE